MFLSLVFTSKVAPMDEDAKQKIREMSQGDIPLTQRRALYNQMNRRMKANTGLPAGLIEKYQACQSQKKERFNLLKEFIIDENMSGAQFQSGFRCSSKDLVNNLWAYISQVRSHGRGLLRPVFNLVQSCIPICVSFPVI